MVDTVLTPNAHHNGERNKPTVISFTQVKYCDDEMRILKEHDILTKCDVRDADRTAN